MSAKADVIILTVASRSAGVVTRAELLGAGLASSTIAERVNRGFLLSVWRGLYEVPEMTTDHTPLFRAVKSIPNSVVSHRSAARLWGFPVAGDRRDQEIHLTAMRGGQHMPIPGCTLHRTRRPIDRAVKSPVASLPITSAAQTLLDLAGTSILHRRLRHVVETQLTAATPDIEALTHLLNGGHNRGVSGTRRLRRLLHELFDADPIPDSTLERRLAGLLAQHGIDGFQPQVKPPWYDGRRGIVDFAHPGAAVIVEVDGRRWHAGRQAMTDDRRRDREAAAWGWLVLRVTANDLNESPTATAAQVAEVVATRLGRRPSSHGTTTAA